MRAERDLARRVAAVEAADGLRPLTLLVDEVDDCPRRPADLGRELHEVVERLLGVGVEDLVRVQVGEALGLVGGHRRADCQDIHRAGM